jgi:hypothetical protein
MSNEEQTWLEIAISKCEVATRAKLTIAIFRLQDRNDEADIFITNATTPEMVTALAAAVLADADPSQ